MERGKPEQYLIDPSKSVSKSLKLMDLFTTAVLLHNIKNLEQLLNLKAKFYYIRMVSLGLAMDDELASSRLSETLKTRCGGSPRAGVQLEEAVREVVHGFVDADPGEKITTLVDNLPYLDDAEDEPKAASKNRLAMEAIGATFNIFFLWLAVIISGTENQPEPERNKGKKSSRNSLDRYPSLDEKKTAFYVIKVLLSKRLDYDTYLMERVLPLARRSSSEHVSMAEVLSKIRDYINYSMSQILVEAIEGNQSSLRDEAEKSEVLALMWQLQCKSDMRVWARGLWVLEYTVPTPLMPVIATSEKGFRKEKDEGSSRGSSSQGGRSSGDVPVVRSSFHPLISGQRLNLKFQLTVAVAPSKQHLQVNMGVDNVRCKVENSKWGQENLGHFPSHLSLAITPLPVAPGLKTSKILVAITKSSSGNTTYQYKYGESAGVGASMGLDSGLGTNAGFSVAASMSAKVTAKAKPWEYEQVRIGENGAAFKWSLQHWEGKGFDRLVGPQAQKSSVFSFGRRVVTNYLVNVPLSSDGGVIFSEADYPETIKWNFPKDMEGKPIIWKVEGRVDTTFMTKEGSFETRAIDFKQKLDWILHPDPDEKKDKDKDAGKESKEDKEGKDKEGKEGKKEKEEKKDKEGEGEEGQGSEGGADRGGQGRQEGQGREGEAREGGQGK